MTLTRRQFLGVAGSTAGTVATGGLLLRLGDGEYAPAVDQAPAPTSSVPSAIARDVATSTTEAVAGDHGSTDRVLVIVQMSGGNDGLNTLVPVTDGRYHDARPSLGLQAEDLIELAGLDSMLHPTLAPLAGFWDQDQLAFVQGLGLPDQTRSHFVALDTWWNATSGLATGGGWLGRWLDATAAGSANPLRSVSLGGGAPALTGSDSRPVIVQNLDGFVLEPPRASTGVVDAFSAMAAPSLGGLFGEAQESIPVAVDTVGTLRTVFETVDGVASGATEALFLAAAAIVSADIGTEVILINVPGFDTHTDQRMRQEDLLAGIGVGVRSMYDRLAESGHADETLVLAYSEFGRRVGENGSGGTDHGNGGLSFLVGPPVAGRQLVGDVDLGSLDNGDVRPSIDARSMYADVLDWLGGPTTEILGGRYDSFALV